MNKHDDIEYKWFKTAFEMENKDDFPNYGDSMKNGELEFYQLKQLSLHQVFVPISFGINLKILCLDYVSTTIDNWTSLMQRLNNDNLKIETLKLNQIGLVFRHNGNDSLMNPFQNPNIGIDSMSNEFKQQCLDAFKPLRLLQASLKHLEISQCCTLGDLSDFASFYLIYDCKKLSQLNTLILRSTFSRFNQIVPCLNENENQRAKESCQMIEKEKRCGLQHCKRLKRVEIAFNAYMTVDQVKQHFISLFPKSSKNTKNTKNTKNRNKMNNFCKFINNKNNEMQLESNEFVDNQDNVGECTEGVDIETLNISHFPHNFDAFMTVYYQLRQIQLNKLEKLTIVDEEIGICTNLSSPSWKILPILSQIKKKTEETSGKCLVIDLSSTLLFDRPYSESFKTHDIDKEVLGIILSNYNGRARGTTLKEITDKFYPWVTKSNIVKALTRLQQKMYIAKCNPMQTNESNRDSEREIVEYRPCYTLQHRQVRR